MFIMPSLTDITDFIARTAEPLAGFLRDNGSFVLVAVLFVGGITGTTTGAGLMFDHAKTLGQARYSQIAPALPTEA